MTPPQLTLARLSQQLIAARKAHGLTQQEAAERMGCDISTIQRLEHGENVRTLTLFAAMDLLGLLELISGQPLERGKE